MRSVVYFILFSYTLWWQRTVKSQVHNKRLNLEAANLTVLSVTQWGATMCSKSWSFSPLPSNTNFHWWALHKILTWGVALTWTDYVATVLLYLTAGYQRWRIITSAWYDQFNHASFWTESQIGLSFWCTVTLKTISVWASKCMYSPRHSQPRPGPWPGHHKSTTSFTLGKQLQINREDFLDEYRGFYSTLWIQSRHSYVFNTIGQRRFNCIFEPVFCIKQTLNTKHSSQLSNLDIVYCPVCQHLCAIP